MVPPVFTEWWRFARVYPQALIRQTKYIVMLTIECSTKIVNFMTPGAGVLVLVRGHRSHLAKMHYFFKNLLLYPQVLIRQTKSTIMMTNEGSTKIVNVMTPGIGVLEASVRPYISHKVKMY